MTVTDDIASTKRLLGIPHQWPNADKSSALLSKPTQPHPISEPSETTKCRLGYCANSQRQVSCGSNHSPHGAFKEKAFCYLLRMQHPHLNETVMAQNSSILRYVHHFGSSTCSIMVLNPGRQASKCILNLNYIYIHYLCYNTSIHCKIIYIY